MRRAETQTFDSLKPVTFSIEGHESRLTHEAIASQKSLSLSSTLAQLSWLCLKRVLSLAVSSLCIFHRCALKAKHRSGEEKLYTFGSMKRRVVGRLVTRIMVLLG